MYRTSPDEWRLELVVKLLIGAAQLFFAPIAFFQGTGDYRDARRSESWPAVEATITRSEVVKRAMSNRDDYTPVVGYSYAVDGRQFTGDRIAFRGLGGPFEDSAVEHAARYPVGAKVQARYNPRQPDMAVLEAGADGNNLVMLILPALLLASGGYIVWIHAVELKNRMSTRKSKPKASSRGRSPGRTSGKPARRRPPLRPCPRIRNDRVAGTIRAHAGCGAAGLRRFDPRWSSAGDPFPAKGGQQFK